MAEVEKIIPEGGLPAEETVEITALTKESVNDLLDDDEKSFYQPTIIPEQAPATAPATAPVATVPIDYSTVLKNIATKHELKSVGETPIEDYFKDVTPENAEEKLVEMISNNIDYAGYLNDRLDPNIIRLQAAIDKGAAFEDVISQFVKQQPDTTNPKGIIALSLKENYGFDETTIQKHLEHYEKSGTLDLEADKARTYLTKRESFIKAQDEAKQTALRSKAMEKMQLEIEETVKEFAKSNDVFGIPISKAEKDAFPTEFRIATTPDPKTGIPPIAKALQSNVVLAKVIYMLNRQDTAFKSMMTAEKEKVKESYERKLFAEPPALSGGSAPIDDKEATLRAFADE